VYVVAPATDAHFKVTLVGALPSLAEKLAGGDGGAAAFPAS
jgi:hypothetical protein